MINTIATIGRYLKRKMTNATPAPIIAIGVDYLVYRICETLNTNSRCYSVEFVIDEEPWNHRTQFAGAELRYPSELVALIKRYRVCAVITTTPAQKVFYEDYLRNSLRGCHCPVLIITQEPGLLAIERQIQQATDL